MVELSTLFNAMTSLLSAILTGLLVYFYKGMRDTKKAQTDLMGRQLELEEKQMDFQETQLDIQQSLSDLNHLQAELIRGQNRPNINFDVINTENDIFALSVNNIGNGIIRRFDIENTIYIPVDIASELGEFDQPDTKEPFGYEIDVVAMNDVESNIFDKYVSMTVGRPEKETNELLSLKPGEKQQKCFVKPDYRMNFGNEYHEYETSEVLQILRELGVSEVVFQWVVKYEDLSGIKYFDTLGARYIQTDECDNLSDIWSSDKATHVKDMRVIRANYYEPPPSD